MRKILWVCIMVSAIGACSADEDPLDCEKSGLIINLDETTNATSCSTNDGSLQVSASGGKEPYSFFLNDQPLETTGQIANLTAGSYSVLVRDANDCTASVDNVVILADDFSFTTILQPNTSCLSGNGSATIEVVNNNPPYTFKLGTGDFTPNNTFTGLSSGAHVIAVQDNNNCVVTLSVTIPQGFTGISWTNEIKPLLETKCAISGCHNGVSRSNDFRQYASAKSFSKNIKSKTQDRSMPFDGKLTQDQIDIIGCWVDDGALQN